MSTITFICDGAQKESIKTGIWGIIKNHYFNSAFPNTNAKYENEGDEIYLERLDELMKNSLCQIEDTDSGICVTFDSTEDAGFSIASEVYGTSMGYSDNGLTYIVPVFEKIFEQFPSVPFDAHAECADGWAEQEYDVSNDGTTLKINSIEIQVYNQILKMLEEGEDIETISEETGVPVEEIEELLS
jgi:hypothetical protein